ncbi:hypothetical protein BKA67DRAFT_532422 [Truncatella angustata]|uniref:Uncharacterized protein n=1 Tax=Truncatella angustata TaxID=152316 RepID=A0A9P9A0E9_9PEZI|nr:uncharacterized protein BKA67DRAFT_532422 [Truncatella angustata]KAH6657198.1 hypothetical protein BKA67DRAFT_532422 [Truncatella angustata]
MSHTVNTMMVLPIKGKMPRMDPYQRLINRFFEPLILQYSLGKTQGDYIPGTQEKGTTNARRRRLLENICYICDYNKGGDTTTSIGLEERHDCFNFWVASNIGSTGMVDFIADVLNDTQVILTTDQRLRSIREQRLIQKCINFARKRVKKEANLLSKVVEKCKDHLREESGILKIDGVLLHWLSTFDTQDSIALCERAYEVRKGLEMKELVIRSQVGEDEPANSDRAPTFALVRHMLGRLAHHVRAPRQIVDDASHLNELLQNYVIRRVDIPPCIPPPKADGLTTLPSILKRMLPANDSTLPNYEAALLNLDRKLQIGQRVLEQYQLPSFKPRVHSEIQVLEHFYKGGLAFAGNDCFIASSKPACYCCHLYIRSHPLNLVEPASHKNLYLNWGVPLLPGGVRDPDFKDQQKIIIKMLETIRREALDRIMRQTGGPKGHPDSLTGITPSMSVISAAQAARLTSLESQLSGLTIDSNGVSSVNGRNGSEDSDFEGSVGASSDSSDNKYDHKVSQLGDSDSDDDCASIGGGARLHQRLSTDSLCKVQSLRRML